MAGSRRYRFIGAWALAQIVVGSLLVFAAALAVLVVFSPWSPGFIAQLPPESRARLVPAAVAAIALAVVLGGALVVSGQVLRLLRDVHRHVARLDARDARRARGTERPSQERGAASRLIPRR